ncbi:MULTISPECIES: TonB-dependent siderophore receptor [unclassified Sphingomonas]|uniref:TonB-dependent receptor n=1 Tax=unclassified Sphingomonas TaxID=196159 RepID=UPI000DBBF378|nr:MULTISPECIES: TonB-dependent siderophore receptor [unclassified Sphingomonas]PZT91411.1 MAG: TonB-dependent siderophore receptor [Sphingomonas sp.]RSV29560.1 TonB-dependent siderophore receptor [Sphingomonas sp. ABOLH]
MSFPFVVAALAAAAPVAAPVAPEPDPQEIVVTGAAHDSGYVPQDSAIAKTPAPLRDLPQSVAVVGAEVLRDQRALSVQDALKNVAGVGFSSGDGQRDQVTIRGFSAIADQYVDGFRDDGLYFRDLSNVERIEVVKGPAAVLYGRGSSGGLINRVTKKPDGDVTGAAITGGSFGNVRGEFDIGRLDSDSGVGVRVTGAYQDSDSFREQGLLRRTAIAPSFVFGRGKATSLLVQADYLTDRRVNDFGIPAVNGRPVAVNPRTYYGAANARTADAVRSDVLGQGATLLHRFSDSLSLRNGFRHYGYRLRRRNTQPSAVNAAAGTVTLSHGGIDRVEDGWSNQTELTQRATIAGMEHSILYGVEIARQVKDARTIATRVVAVTSLTDPVNPVVDNATFTALSANQRNRLDTTGLYVQDLIDIGHGVKALVGLRHDIYRQRTDQRLVGQADFARTDRNWSPRAGIVFQPDDAQSYYASWSRSFQPSAEQFGLAATNADIAPEETVNREIGAKYTLFGGRLGLQAAGFILKRTGIKGTDPTTQAVLPIGTQRTRGIELSGQLDLAGWRAVAGYAYLDATVVASATPALVGRGATLTPKHQANVSLVRDFGRFGLGGGGNVVGDRWADPANTTKLPGYVTADALGWVDVAPAVRVQVNGYNLFDRRYIVAGHGSSPLLNMPGSPRSVLATVRLAL